MGEDGRYDAFETLMQVRVPVQRLVLESRCSFLLGPYTI